MHQGLALGISFLFVFAWIGIASALLGFGKISPFVTRKIVHIGVSHWWIFAMLFFESTLLALVGPVSFIIINYISYRKHLFAAMEHEIPKDNLGTIYFPVSLLILVLVSFPGPMPKSVAGAGILILGYGDGFAALVGHWRADKSWTFPCCSKRKTLAGSAAMVVFSLLVLLFFQFFFWDPAALTGGRFLVLFGIALVAALAELFTPFGLDNISVPLVTSFLVWVLVW